MKSLETHVEEYYRNSQLDSAVLESLLKVTPRQKDSGRWAFATAALLFLVVTSGYFYQYGSFAEQSHFILEEASVNHQSKLQLEFVTPHFQDLSSRMSELNFPVSLPEKIRGKYELIGARYCTLSGRLAAHVKLSDSGSSGDVSLFMTRDSEQFANLDQISELLDGVSVSSWSENGMFYVLASNQP